MLTIEDIQQDRLCVVALGGRIDSSSAERLTEHLRQVLRSGTAGVIVDLKEVAYLTSAAFRSLLVATDDAETAGASFCLCGVQGYVRELFEMGGLLDTFTVWDTREEALAKAGGAP